MAPKEGKSLRLRFKGDKASGRFHNEVRDLHASVSVRQNKEKEKRYQKESRGCNRRPPR